MGRCLILMLLLTGCAGESASRTQSDSADRRMFWCVGACLNVSDRKDEHETDRVTNGEIDEPPNEVDTDVDDV
jgi:hypothetical protein